MALETSIINPTDAAPNSVVYILSLIGVTPRVVNIFIKVTKENAQTPISEPMIDIVVGLKIFSILISTACSYATNLYWSSQRLICLAWERASAIGHRF